MPAPFSEDDIAKVEVKDTNYAIVGPGIGLLVIGLVLVIACSIYYQRGKGGSAAANTKLGALIFGIIVGVMCVVGGSIMIGIGAEAKKQLKASDVDQALQAAAAAAPTV